MNGAGSEPLGLEIRNDATELRRLTSEAERWANLFEHIELGVVIISPGGAIDLCNPAFARMHGYQREEVLGRSAQELFAGRGLGDVDGNVALIEERGHHVWEALHVRADGTEFPVVIDATAVRDEHGTSSYRAATVKDITTRHAAAARLAHLASHDELTGLANRALLLEETGRALAAADGDHHVAVLFCDLDEFKVVNDSIGHAAGDALLVVLAERLVEALPAEAVAARPGGDEFVFLVGDLDADRTVAEEQARVVAAKLLRAIAEPIEIQGRRLHTTMSIGIALSDGDGCSPAELLMDSDAAMYRAKAAGRSSIGVFDQELRAVTQRRVQVESELRDAVAGDQLVVQYQPIVDLATEEVVGAEALLRWQHPSRGLLLPGEFLDVAEAVGLMDEIGRHVLEEAAGSVADWRRASGKDVYVSVNVAAAQLGSGRLTRQVRSLLAEHDLPPSAISLEITENTLLASDGEAARELADLVASGTNVGLDDFGTGYGSLTHLMSSGASFLKLDRQFVQAAESPIAEAVIGLGNALDLEVIAEGIETLEQARTLVAMGARHGQGYLYGRSMGADAFAERLTGPGPTFAD